MAYQCPHCSASESAEVTSRIRLPPDGESDEIALLAIECSRCGFAGIEVIEESRRGSLDFDLGHRQGYCVDGHYLQTLKASIEKCPEPGNPGCTCPVHSTLGATDASGRSAGVVDIISNKIGLFRMEH